jgi:hypothetical protein
MGEGLPTEPLSPRSETFGDQEIKIEFQGLPYQKTPVRGGLLVNRRSAALNRNLHVQGIEHELDGVDDSSGVGARE